MDLTVILVSYNSAQLLGQAIDSLYRAASRLEMEVIVVDNSSRDDSVALLRRQYPDCRVIANALNVGFGRANNQALGHIRGRHVLLLNTDAFVSADSLDKTIAYMQAHPRCGVLGVRLVGRDGSLQPSARYFPTPWNIFLQRTNLQRWFRGMQLVDDMQWDHASARQCDWVPGCFYLVRRQVIDQVGLFDPRYFLYYEEIDHCFAVKKAGWEVVFFPDTTVVHIGGESARSDGEVSREGQQIEALRIESELLYFRKNHGLTAALASVLLTTLGDAIILVKRIFRGRWRGAFRPYARHAGLAWTLLFRTRLGSRPTR